MKIQIEGPLLEVLYQQYKDVSKKKVKNYLKMGCIYINGQQVTKYNFPVFVGDELEIRKENKTHHKCLLPILFEDEDFLVIEKPAGLLSIATEKEKERTAYHEIRDFIKKRGRGEKIFLLHRLDKDTSGILVFTKKQMIKQRMQAEWNTCVEKRGYIAIVDGIAKEEETLRFYLKEDSSYRMRITSSQKGKLALTQYRCLEKGKKRSLLQIQITTGRKNQIRASLEEVNLPILGDKKYGGKKADRLYLHANQIVFVNPITKKKYHFESKMPRGWKTKLYE